MDFRYIADYKKEVYYLFKDLHNLINNYSSYFLHALEANASTQAKKDIKFFLQEIYGNRLQEQEVSKNFQAEERHMRVEEVFVELS